MQFVSEETLKDVVSNEQRARMLTDFFRINNERPEGPQLMYT